MASVASETYTATSAPIQFAAISAFQESEAIDNYLYNSRRILRAIAKTLSARLEALNVTFPKPEGGFYFFCNFEHYREKLISKGIYTSVELCERLLNDIGVAILPGSDFGRQPEELTARIAYVDFNGSKALEAAKLYADNGLDESFVEKNCIRLIRAFDKLGNWLNEL
jgi:aspartate aminotransferase